MKKILFITLFLFATLVFPMRVAALTYLFPWPDGESWGYALGWHYNGYNYALDMSSSGRKQVLASADGTVSNICPGTLSYNVTVINDDGFTMSYMHIHKDYLEPGIVQYASIKKGQLIGVARPGTWDDGCGETQGQAAETAHVHWTFQNGTGRVVDAWTIQDYANSTIQLKDQYGTVLESRNPGSSFTSTNPFIIRNQTITIEKGYQTNGSIFLMGDGNGLNLNPSAGNSVVITSM